MMTVPSKIEKQDIEKVEDKPSNMVSMIEQLIMRPDLQVEKVEQLFELQLRVEANDNKRAFNAAFAKMQAQIPATVRRGEIKNKTGGVQSKYPLWEDIVEDIMPVLVSNGFGLRFNVTQPDGHVKVVGILAHDLGHSEQTEITLPADTSGSKNAVQSIGSSVSYGKRYVASALLNLTSKNHIEDDDGQKGGGEPETVSNGKITQDQADQLIGLADKFSADKRRFLEFMGKKWGMELKGIPDIPAARFDESVAWLHAAKGASK